MAVTTKAPEAKYDAIQELQNAHLDATFTVGTEATNVINVSCQLKEDRSGTAVATRRVVDVYFADAATGAAVVASAPSGGAAIGTNGSILATVVSGKMYRVVSNASGVFDLNITESGAKTLYVVVVEPGSGRLLVSGAVTFA